MGAQRGQPGEPDGHIGEALPPRAPERVGDDDGDVDPAPLRQPGADPGGRRRRGRPAAGRSCPCRCSRCRRRRWPSPGPARVCTMRVRPRAATTRTDSASTAARRVASRSSPAGTSRPSALLTTLDVTTTTSPAARGTRVAAISSARSSPGGTSGSPRTGSTDSTRHLQRFAGQRGGFSRVRHVGAGPRRRARPPPRPPHLRCRRATRRAGRPRRALRRNARRPRR